MTTRPGDRSVGNAHIDQEGFVILLALIPVIRSAYRRWRNGRRGRRPGSPLQARHDNA
jgi:hypothetical protein